VSTKGGVATFFCILLRGTAYLFTEESHLVVRHCPGWAGPMCGIARFAWVSALLVSMDAS